MKSINLPVFSPKNTSVLCAAFHALREIYDVVSMDEDSSLDLEIALLDGMVNLATILNHEGIIFDDEVWPELEKPAPTDL